MKRLLLILLAAVPALAEEPKAPEVIATLPGTWNAFGPGTWVDIRTTATVGTKTSGQLTRSELKKYDYGLPHVLTKRPAEQKTPEYLQPMTDTVFRTENLRRAKDETLEVNGKQLRCQVWETIPPANLPSEDTQRWWFCAEAGVPGGLVRIQDDRRGSFPVTIDWRLVETGRVVQVAGRKLTCAVFLMSESREAGKWTSEFEEITSPEVPGGLVKKTGHSFSRTGDTPVTQEYIDELVAMEIVVDEHRAIREHLEKTSNPWRRARPGAWLDRKSTVRTPRETTVNEDRRSVELVAGELRTRTHELKRLSTADGRPVLDVSAGSLDSRAGRTEFRDIKAAGKETLRVGDAEVVCEIYEMEREHYDGRHGRLNPGTKERARIWYAPTLAEHVRVVKETVERETPSGQEISSTVLVELDRGMNVGDRKVAGAVYRETTSWNGEASRSTEVRFVAPEVPGWVLRQEFRIVHVKDGVEDVIEQVSETTDWNSGK